MRTIVYLYKMLNKREIVHLSVTFDLLAVHERILRNQITNGSWYLLST